MKLTFKISGNDFTDYVESIRLENHAEGIIQSNIPSLVFIVILSTKLSSYDADVQDEILFGVNYKSIRLNIVKISRGKETTEIRAEWIKPSNSFLKGCFSLNDLDLLYLDYNSDLKRKGQQIYINKLEDIPLGITITSYKQTMIDNNLPNPFFSKSEMHNTSSYVIRQLRTLSEFNSANLSLTDAYRTSKVEIDYDDVIQEEEITSRVDPTAISISKLKEKIEGMSFKYLPTKTWSNTFDEIRLYECESANAYGIGIITGSGTTAKTELHMSDGSIYTIKGIVGGVTPEWYYRCYTDDLITYKVELCRFSDNSVIHSISAVENISGGSNKILDDIATHNEVIRIRQNQSRDTNPADLIFFGKPSGEANLLFLGASYYKNSQGDKNFRLIPLSLNTYPEMRNTWFLGSHIYDTDNYVTVRYGKQGAIIDIKINYDGDILEYNYISNMDDTLVYPISSANSPWISLTGVKVQGTSKVLIYGKYTNGDITWSSLPDENAQIGWFIKGNQDISIIVKTNESFEWRDRRYIESFARTHINLENQEKLLQIITYSNSILIKGTGVSNSYNTVILEASPLPQNTYNLDEITVETGNVGESEITRLPFVLQGGNQALPLVPTNKTRLSVQTSAIKFTKYGSYSIRMTSGNLMYAIGRIQSIYNTQPQPNHKYYMSVEINAPSGIFSTNASFAWGAEEDISPHPILVDLNNTPATSLDEWVKKSVLVQIPSSFSEYVSDPGVVSNNASASWEFRYPMIIDLTEKFGQGNEPSKEWCDENLELDDGNMLENYSLEAVDQAWKNKRGAILSPLYYPLRYITKKFKIDNEDLILPQIGTPVLYHRTTPKYTLNVSTGGGWERLYLPVSVQQGKKYILKFNYKVNRDYRSLGWSTHETVPVQVLSAIPSVDDAGEDIEIASADTSLIAMDDYVEEVISFIAPSNTVYLSINFGFAEDGQNVSISYTDFYLSSVDLDENILGNRTDLNTWIIPQYMSAINIVSTDLGEEGIVLGFDYEFNGSSQLYVDILLLGNPKPWSNSVI